jgi:hypothetical protein
VASDSSKNPSQRTEGETDEIETVQKRQVVWRYGIRMCLRIVITKLLLVGDHCLTCGDSLVVESIVEGRAGNQSDGEGQPWGEMLKEAVMFQE